LKANVDFMRRGLSDIGFELPAGHATPIFPIVIGENDAAMRASEALKGKGYWVTAIRPPSVPAGTARLRATVMSSHEPADLQSFLDALASVAPHASNSPT
jgi:8-amino-7-oxononanoate synthase